MGTLVTTVTAGPDWSLTLSARTSSVRSPKQCVRRVPGRFADLFVGVVRGEYYDGVFWCWNYAYEDAYGCWRSSWSGDDWGGDLVDVGSEGDVQGVVMVC